MNMKNFAFATAVMLVGESSLIAQDTQLPKTADRQSQSNQARSTRELATKDQTFGTLLAIADDEQVILSRFAKEKANHPAVKAYAGALETSHQASWNQLKAMYPQIESSGTAVAAKPQSTKAGPIIAASSPLSGDVNPTVDFVELQREISIQCLSDSKKMLDSKNGVEFDQCFIGMQIAKHTAAHSTLTVLHRHTTGKLQTFVMAELETNAKHLKAASDLMEQLSASEPSSFR